MSIIYTYQKSKKKNKTKKEIAEYQAWLDSVNNMTTNFSIGKAKVIKSGVPKLTVPVGRETPRYPSLNNGVDTAPATKKTIPVYTGTAMKGIGTLHKSNAVPIFTDEEARDQASMRR